MHSVSLAESCQHPRAGITCLAMWITAGCLAAAVCQQIAAELQRRKSRSRHAKVGLTAQAGQPVS